MTKSAELINNGPDQQFTKEQWLLIRQLMQEPKNKNWAPIELATKNLSETLQSIKKRIEKNLEKRGIQGTLAFFVNIGPNSGDGTRKNTIIGVPVYSGTDDELITTSALFFPKNPTDDPKELKRIQNEIALSLSFTLSQELRIKRVESKISLLLHRYPPLVVSPTLINSWKIKNKMIPIPEEILRHNQRLEEEDPPKKDWRRLTHENKPGSFLTEHYFPSLVEGIQLLLKQNLLPVDLRSKLSGKLVNILKDESGNVAHVSLFLTLLLNTNHNKDLKQFAFESYEFCSLVLKLLFTQGTEFGIPELLKLDELREKGLRSDRVDNNHMMGVDFANTLDYAEVDFDDDKVCGCPLHTYHQIYDSTNSISTEWGSSQLHHIVPRGLAYHALTIAYLKGLIDESTSPRDMMLLLRGAKISEFVSRSQWHLFLDEEKMQNFLEKAPTILLAIDKAVNSPYNLIPLCIKCHEEVHPDMRYLNEIAGFMAQVNAGKITTDDINDKTVNKIINGHWKTFAPRDRDQIFELVHQARQLVFGQGVMYHIVFMPKEKSGKMNESLDLMDQMLSNARLVADQWFEKQENIIKECILNLQNITATTKHIYWKVLANLQEHGLHNTWILAEKIISESKNKKGIQNLEPKESTRIDLTASEHKISVSPIKLDLETAQALLKIIKSLNLPKPFVVRKPKPYNPTSSSLNQRLETPNTREKQISDIIEEITSMRCKATETIIHAREHELTADETFDQQIRRKNISHIPEGIISILLNKNKKLLLMTDKSYKILFLQDEIEEHFTDSFEYTGKKKDFVYFKILSAIQRLGFIEALELAQNILQNPYQYATHPNPQTVQIKKMPTKKEEIINAELDLESARILVDITIAIFEKYKQ